MKIIHCADLHLNSKLSANFNKEKAIERSRELTRNFTRLVSFANENNVSAILIAGDLFDTKVVSKLVINTVVESIIANPHLDFYYLKGNHDRNNFLNFFDDIPENLKLFGESWTEYILNDSVHIYGVELTSENSYSSQVNFYPNPSDINIVMLHGQESAAVSGDKTEIINLKNFKNKGIDYMALGHIHRYFSDSLDGRGKYCYSGCLEARGFDECGQHGFVLLDIDTDRHIVKDEFVPFAQREFHEIAVDVSDCFSSNSIIEVIKTILSERSISPKNMLKIVLIGERDIESECDINYITKEFEEEFYLFKIFDETTIHIEFSEYALDKSLKGAFVRCVRESDYSEDEKKEIIQYGIKAISGGEIL